MGAMEDPSTRAARLRALRQAAGLDTSEQDLNGSAADTADQPVLKFRNYTVRDDKITHEKTAVANPPKYEQPVVEADVDVEGEVTDACGLDQQPVFVRSLSVVVRTGTAVKRCAKEAKLGLAKGC